MDNERDGSSTPTGPLAGVVIADLSRMVSGPYASLLMGDQGADVIKVEPINGDQSRQVGSFRRGGVEAFSANVTRGKRSVALDLHAAEAREVVADLAATADVFIQNFRPGVVEQMGLGYDDLSVRNPDLVYVSISGYGPVGPYADRPAYDTTIQAMSGIVARQRPMGGEPDLIRQVFVDKLTALFVAQAATAALLAVRDGSGGQHIHVSMLDATLYFAWPDLMVDHTIVGEGVTEGQLVSSQVNLTPASDGYVSQLAVSFKQRQAVLRAVGREDLLVDPRFATREGMIELTSIRDFIELVDQAAARLTVAELLDRLGAEDVPCGPVLDPSEVVVDEHVRAVGSLWEWEHPEAGLLRQARPPARFGRTEQEPKLSLSEIGANGDEILRSLGRTPEQIASLRSQGVLV